MYQPSPADLDQTKPGWYLALMAPNTRGPQWAWLDPCPIYLFPESFTACVEDLAAPFIGDQVDLVAGIDAMGFILGAALARRLNVGLLPVRKSGKLPYNDTIAMAYRDYQAQSGEAEKQLEIRNNPFPKGTRVLVVDQWVQTGGTACACVALVESCGGVVAGIATICLEETAGGRELMSKYRCVHCAPTELQEQVNQQELDSFKLFKRIV